MKFRSRVSYLQKTRGASPNVRMPAVFDLPSHLQWAAVVLRAAFIGLIMVLILRVSQPQSETVWSAYETKGDLVRLTLGLGACLWMGIQVFSFPKDADAYRIWLYLGLIGVPAAMLLIATTW
jgi:hypothetical protein